MIIVFWQFGPFLVERSVQTVKQAATLMIIKRSQGFVPQMRQA